MSLITITDRDGARWLARRMWIRGVNFDNRELLPPRLHIQKVRRLDWTTEPIYEDAEQAMGDTKR